MLFLCGSMVKCMTCNPRGPRFKSSCLVLVKPRKYMSRWFVTVIWLKYYFKWSETPFIEWTLYFIDTYFKASASGSIWKHCGKRRNCSWQRNWTLKKNPFENIVGKGENAGNQHFLLFPQCFLPVRIHMSIYQSPLFCRLQMLSISTGLKFCRLEELRISIFSSTGQRPASYCHDLVSIVGQSVGACVHKFFLQKTSPWKLLTGFLPNFTVLNVF